MTLDEINRAIAEHLGWKPCKYCDNKTWRRPDDRGCQEHLPNYSGDLNAMHEAEKSLTDEDFEQHYGPFLGAAAHARSRRALICATATQRAEAFVRTIGKWRDA